MYCYFYLYFRSYSNARKCSNGGRGLMQLDYTQLKLKFESITGLRPMPYNEFVESYVKAYYIPENTLREWIECHKVCVIKESILYRTILCQ